MGTGCFLRGLKPDLQAPDLLCRSGFSPIPCLATAPAGLAWRRSACTATPAPVRLARLDSDARTPVGQIPTTSPAPA